MYKYLSLASALFLTTSTIAQTKENVSSETYQKAEQFLSYNVSKHVETGNNRPNWLKNNQFWYIKKSGETNQFMLVNPVKKIENPLFDNQKLAEALNQATGKTYQADALPFQTLTLSDDGKSMSFLADGKNWNYDLTTKTIKQADKATTQTSNARFQRNEGVLSPNGKLSAFIKDDNLWVKNTETNQLTQLTTDGEKNYGYATDNAGWTHSDNAILRWSPDSKKIATFKQDQRKVSDMYLVTTNVGAPKLEAWKYPLPGDKFIPMIERVIIEVETPKVIKIKIPADPHRASLSDDISSSGTFDDVDWSADGSQLAFLSTSRDHKQEKFRIADAATGEVREVFEEVVATQYESGQGAINWNYLEKTNEIIWYSERDDWGHLYLYDAKTGKLKNQITKGTFTISRVVKTDEAKRIIYFLAGGKEPGNPYFSYLYKVGFDGKNLKLLTPGLGNHQISFSPTETYITDTYSQPDVPQVTVVRDLNGNLISEIAKTDISKLLATGWKAPTPVKLLAADQKTDIYGLVFTPTKMEAGKKYPVVDYIYPGPQGGSVGSWSFSAARGDHQALAELGFIVVMIEGTSNPGRSKSYHDMSYGNMSINTLPDQITGIQQLAKLYPIDLDKVGIWGHSGGGFATATALFKYPDFFKVGISESGNHDNRNYEDDWGERYNGLAENVDYASQANQLYAKNLKGKLMLAHGMMDDNVPPSNTLLVVDALIKANKDFDLVLFPNSRHGFGVFSPYMMRKRWDYFVTHLQGKTPPKEFALRGTQIDVK
jgi:dipeptidyl aminopeptidase/acylaminoacyl peptidase